MQGKIKIFIFIIFVLCFSVFSSQIVYAVEICIPSQGINCPDCYRCTNINDKGVGTCVASDSLSCSSCDKISTCGHFGCGSCQFSPGSCRCSSGSCIYAGWWCEPVCPDPVTEYCTSNCATCKNPPVECFPGGGGGCGTCDGKCFPSTNDCGDPCPPCGCTCNCDSDNGLTSPAQVLTLSTPANGSTKVNDMSIFSWQAIADWGKNIKTCTTGDPGVNCPDGLPADGGEHRYEIAFFTTNNTASTPIHTAIVDGTSWYFDSNPLLSSCTTYYWAVRAINRQPVSVNCREKDMYGPYSPTRSFRTNCTPVVLSVTPDGGRSGRYAYGSDGFPNTYGITCNRNNPTQFTLTVEDPDGNGDIALAQLFIAGDGITTPAQIVPSIYEESIRQTVLKGTIITIRANGTSVKTIYPKMGLYINGQLVKIWSNVGYNGRDAYRYYTTAPVRAQDIKISFLNDAYEDGEDRNLTEVELYINGVKQTNRTVFCATCGNTSTGALWGNGLESWFQYSGSTYYGDNSFTGYGMNYISDINIPGASNAWKNYAWGVPNSGSSEYITTMLTEQGTDLLNTDRNDTNYKGHIKLISVANVDATKKRFVYEVTFGGDNSNKLGDVLNIFGHVSDYSGKSSGHSRKATHHLDFTPPTGSISMSVLTQNVINVLWDSADSNGIAGTSILSGFNPTTAGYDGDTGVFSTGKPLLINAGVLGKGDPTQVWLGNGEDDGVGTINIASVDDAGEFNSELVAADTLCNVNTFDTVDGIRLGASWYISKGGLAYSRGSYYSPLVAYAEGGSIHSSLGINKEEVNISSELLGSGNAAFGDEQDNLTRPFMIKNFNSVINSGYTRYRDVVLSKVQAYPEKYQQIAYSSDALSGNISIQCPDANKMCVLVRNGKLNIDNPLVCDRKTVVITSSDLTVSKGVTSTGDLNGCIFLSGNDIDIKAFYGALPADVEYDVVHGFFIADNQIHIENDLASQPRGLRVVGSMIGFSDTNSGIKINRSLQLRQNLEYPSVAVEYDNRYYILSREFFGLIEVYRKDSGYKPY